MSRILFECRDVLIEFLDRTILKIDNLKIHDGEMIGLVAPNGKGKTTLLKFISGEEDLYKGHRKLYGTVSHCTQANLAKKYVVCDLEKKIIKIDNRNLSGGELSKLKFLNAFEKYPDILLLDEPTTHMDEEGKKLVINSLKSFNRSLILVTHDRHLLNMLVNVIWEIQDTEIKSYTGNFNNYQKQKEEEFKNLKEQYKKSLKEKRRLQLALLEKEKVAEMVINRKGNREYRDKPGVESRSKQTAEKTLHKAAKNIKNV